MAVKKTAGATKVKVRSTSKKATPLKAAATKKAASLKKNVAAKKTKTVSTATHKKAASRSPRGRS